jgi:hypothetical protein
MNNEIIAKLKSHVNNLDLIKKRLKLIIDYNEKIIIMYQTSIKVFNFIT